MKNVRAKAGSFDSTSQFNNFTPLKRFKYTLDIDGSPRALGEDDFEDELLLMHSTDGHTAKILFLNPIPTAGKDDLIMDEENISFGDQRALSFAETERYLIFSTD